MADAKELLQRRIDDERQYAKEHFDVEFKAVGYLLAANAAGLAACVTLLKDYAAVPQLKGTTLEKNFDLKHKLERKGAAEPRPA
jgi:hypothetical protein